MPEMHTTTLFRSPLLAVRDVCCRPLSAACGGEECAAANVVVFPRAGLFVQHVGKDSIVADANQVLFFVPYKVSHPVPGGDDCTVLAFSSDVLLDALARHDPAARDRPMAPFRYTHGPSAPAAICRQQILRRWFRHDPPEALAVEELALQLLEAVLASSYSARGHKPARCRPQTTRAHRELVQATQTVLAERFRGPLSLSSVARAVHSSPYHLARVFRRGAGIPIHKYLCRLRLRAALDQLAEGARDLTRLAFDVGFSSHSHFTNSFRSQFGISPSQFRTMPSLRQMSKKLKA